MPGRRLLNEGFEIDFAYGPDDPIMIRRREVLRETVRQLSDAGVRAKYHESARANLERWAVESNPSSDARRVHVVCGDWGDVTNWLTRIHGECFAVLNMANAYVPGGAYVEGAAAQEENMFRRTDCHFSIGEDVYDAEADRYLPSMSSLLQAQSGRVYLDRSNTRVCVRAAEERSVSGLGYEWLDDAVVFPFYEMRASAQDLRTGEVFSESVARKRIAAQLDTLIDAQITHAVLGAFGCGAFLNPSEAVAYIYRQEIEQRRDCFSVIAFAIFDPGYGPDNFSVFKDVFRKEIRLDG